MSKKERTLTNLREQYEESKINDPSDFYFRAYVVLGGKQTKEAFLVHLKKFDHFTCMYWTMGELPHWWNEEEFEASGLDDPREFLWNKWVSYIKQFSNQAGEAHRFLNAVDAITAYS
jgi:hypothetical protein